MKKIVLFLMVGISTVSYASVVPVEATNVPKTSVTRPDATKMKMLVRAKTLDNSVGKEAVADLQRYRGVVTMDNVKAIENMSRLMQNDPERLMRQMGADPAKLNLNMDRRKMGSNEAPAAYVASPKTDDPAEKLAGLNTPELTGSFAGVRASEDKLMAMHQEALKQIEEIGHEHLGQKSAPIRMPMTVEEIQEMGVDTRRLPKGWEKTLEDAEKNIKSYQEQEAKRKAEAKKAAAAQARQKTQSTQPQQRRTQPTQKVVSSQTKQRKK